MRSVAFLVNVDQFAAVTAGTQDRLPAEQLRRLSQYPLGPAGLLFSTPAGAVLIQNNWRHREWEPRPRLGLRCAA